MSAVTISKVNVLSVPLNCFCSFAKKDDSISITEWTNGEGVDMEMDNVDGSVTKVQFTLGQLKALDCLFNTLNTLE
jgi:hypothetical protein